MNDNIQLLLPLMIGSAVAAFTWLLASLLSSSRKKEIEQVEKKGPVLVRFAAGVGARYFGGEGKFITKCRETADRKLLIAGNPHSLTGRDFMGLMATSMLLSILLGSWVFLISALNPILLLLVCMIIGFILPLNFLKERVQKRLTSIRKELPYALDLMTLVVESGLDFTEALRMISVNLENSPLANEFQRVLHSIQLGQLRTDALRSLSKRLDLTEVSSFVSSLIQAERLGSRLGPVLRIQSEQMRIQRALTAEKKAMEAPVKILFPLVVFIFPCTFVIIFGPLVLRWLLK